MDEKQRSPHQKVAFLGTRKKSNETITIIITLAAGLFAVTALAGDPRNPSFHDGNWYHIAKSGERIRGTPNATTIRDGYWFHYAPVHADGLGRYTRDQYGNYIEF
jgi:hypothetical protein